MSRLAFFVGAALGVLLASTGAIHSARAQGVPTPAPAPPPPQPAPPQPYPQQPYPQQTYPQPYPAAPYPQQPYPPQPYPQPAPAPYPQPYPPAQPGYPPQPYPPQYPPQPYPQQQQQQQQPPPVQPLPPPPPAEPKEGHFEIQANIYMPQGDYDSFDTGFGGGLQHGFPLRKNLSLEIQGRFIYLQANSATSVYHAEGHAGPRFTLPVGPKLSIYGEGLLGHAWTWVQVSTFGYSQTIDGSGMSFQLGGGLHASLSPHVYFGAGLQYSMASVSIGGGDVSADILALKSSIGFAF